MENQISVTHGNELLRLRVKQKASEAATEGVLMDKVLKILQNSQEKTCVRLWHRCFPVNFAKLLRTPFFTEHHWTTASEALQ